jgi:hypothetical protein
MSRRTRLELSSCAASGPPVVCGVNVTVPVFPVPGESIWTLTVGGTAAAVTVTAAVSPAGRVTVTETDAGVPS